MHRLRVIGICENDDMVQRIENIQLRNPIRAALSRTPDLDIWIESLSTITFNCQLVLLLLRLTCIRVNYSN